MAKGGTWEFDCPQFVDFAAGLHNETTDYEFPRTSRCENEPNPLTSSMLSSADGQTMVTPNVKRIKKIDLRNSPFVNTVRQQTDDEKLAKLTKKKLRRSKSIGDLNEIGNSAELELFDHVPKFLSKPPKRSFSEVCLRRKRICPATPMCLKRTKPKPKAKTTEELELEKIKELRNNLSKQLKLNQVNFKRSMNKKSPYGLEDLYKIERKALPSNRDHHRGDEDKVQHIPKMTRNEKGQVNFAANLGVKVSTHSEENRNLALKQKGERLRKVLGNVQSAAQKNALRELNSNEPFRKTPFLKKQPYCGIKFFPSQEKTVPHPFSFDNSCSSLPNASFKLTDRKTCFSTSAWIPNETVDKENVMVANKNYSAIFDKEK